LEANLTVLTTLSAEPQKATAIRHSTSWEVSFRGAIPETEWRKSKFNRHLAQPNSVDFISQPWIGKRKCNHTGPVVILTAVTWALSGIADDFFISASTRRPPELHRDMLADLEIAHLDWRWASDALVLRQLPLALGRHALV
jgi:hypothetical protein